MGKELIRIKNKSIGYYKWIKQGRPRNEPVVIKQGYLFVDANGQGLMTGWRWDFRFMAQSIDLAQLWEIYSARYPVERVQGVGGWIKEGLRSGDG